MSRVSSFFIFKNEIFPSSTATAKLVSLPVACQFILPAINAFALGFRVWDSGYDLQLLCGLTEWPSSSCAFSLCLRHFHTVVIMILDSLKVCFICYSRVNYPGFCHCVNYRLPAPMGTAGWAWALVWALMQISSFLMFWSLSLGGVWGFLQPLRCGIPIRSQLPCATRSKKKEKKSRLMWD